MAAVELEALVGTGQGHQTLARMALHLIDPPMPRPLLAQVEANRAIGKIHADFCRVRVLVADQSAKAIAVCLEGRERCRVDAVAQAGFRA